MMGMNVKKIFKDVKFLFPGSKFKVRYDIEELYEVNEVSFGEEWTSWTENVIDWSPFSLLIGDNIHSFVALELGLGGYDGRQLVFRIPGESSPSIDARRVIRSKATNFERSDPNPPVSPEERIRQLEKELAETNEMLKKQEKFEACRRGADEISSLLEIMVKAGLRREEAFQLIMASLPIAIMENLISK